MTRTIAGAAVACVVALALASLPADDRRATAGAEGPQACAQPTQSITLYADELPDGRIGYGRSPDNVKVPGPTIQLTEGDCVEVTLVNRAAERVSAHAHGVDYTVASDGTPLNDGCVAPGRQRTFVWSTHAPSARTDGTVRPGSAGYWHYHDHCMGTPHGTKGIARGLFGALIVRRAGDPVPDRRPKVLVMSGVAFNLERAPHTPMPRANLGERVEFVVIGHGDLFHTFHLHGHRWADTRTGHPATPAEDAVVVDNRTVGPGDSFGFQIVAGEDVGPGAWMYHCHVQNHSDAGMEGLFVVRQADGTLDPQTRAAVREWRSSHGR
ncbi:MAG TPA: multicopper oxidase domain-containing protein [Actinomycetota bacterium]|nr:multicopper oxidase domain-containing protein [Actinomycetota bacterium]